MMFESWLPMDSETRKKRNCNASWNIGAFTSATETTGYNSGWSGTGGYQFGLEKTFQGPGYISYNASVPLVGGGVLTTDSGTLPE